MFRENKTKLIGTVVSIPSKEEIDNYVKDELVQEMLKKCNKKKCRKTKKNIQ